jgi:hypothetical protein
VHKIQKDIRLRLIFVYVAAATYKIETNSKLIGAFSVALLHEAEHDLKVIKTNLSKKENVP